MDRNKIDEIVKSSFDSVFSKWDSYIEKELYPDAFANEHSWMRVKNSLKINNIFLRDALTEIISTLLDQDDQ